MIGCPLDASKAQTVPSCSISLGKLQRMGWRFLARRHKIVALKGVPARYVFHMESWRWVYVVTASITLYLNVFVLIAQLFMKVPPLHALAPTGTEPAFLVAQLIVMLIFVGLTIQAVRKFHIEPALARPRAA